MSPQDDWSQLLTTDMDKLFTGAEERRETITLKKGERRNVTVALPRYQGLHRHEREAGPRGSDDDYRQRVQGADQRNPPLRRHGGQVYRRLYHGPVRGQEGQRGRRRARESAPHWA